MKKLFTLMVLTALAIAAFAQSPQKMSYQCVVRNSSGALGANQAVGMKISILQGSATGIVVFSETYSPNPQTNANGLVTVEIGGGTATVGTFSSIDWASGPYFLKTETDPAGGTSYTITGTSQLLSVPYAMYAKTAANGFSGAWADIAGKPTFSTVATSGSYNDLLNKPALFSGSYNDLTNKPVLFDGTWTSLTGKPLLFDGTWNSLTGKPAGFADGIDNVDDADNSITNEIQALSLNGTVLSLSSGGGSVTLPSSGGGDNWGTQVVVTDASLAGQGTTILPLRIAQQSAITGQVLKWSGTAWAPAIDATSEGSNPTGPAGGDLTGTYPNPTIGDMKVTSAKIQDGTIGTDDLAGDVITTWKIVNGAVTGEKIAQGGATIGQVLKWSGTTWAPAIDATGAGGELSLPFSGTISSTQSAFGVENTGSGNGLYGKGPVGAFGTTGSTTGRGVLGMSHTSGATIAVDGQSPSPDGTAVNGIASSATGTNYGIRGSTNSAIGFSGHFSGGKFYVSGDVGIGTQNPGAKLEVAGQVKITGGTPGVGKVLTSDASGLASWQTAPTVGLTLPYEGTAHTTEVGSSAFKVSNSGSNQVVAISGHATSTTNSAMGIYGRSDAYDGKGIYGIATHKSGITYGVLGVAESTFAYGVWGSANATTGNTYGVYGSSSSPDGYGVFGIAPRYGVRGEATASPGIGVYGAGSTSFMGLTTDSQGDGIRVHCSHSTGITHAVYGTVTSPNGYSGYFIGGRFYVGGNVGIGSENYNPVYRLEVRAPGTTSTGIAGFYNSNGESKVIIRQNSNGSGGVNIYNTGGTGMISLLGEGDSYINGGDVGIGTTSPNYKLDVRGTIGNNTTLYHSDSRWKTDVLPLKYGIQDLMELDGVSYMWNVADYPDMGFDREIQFGFIAQEFEKVIPELVRTDKQGYKSIDYVKLTPLLVMAIQEQQEIISGIKAENDRLKAENDLKSQEIGKMREEVIQINTRLVDIEKYLGSTAEK